ncbi:MAG: HAMP domain-containing protein, partial [Acidobacteria bacterium]|nr:HAMP domain-containing protein [Acidobacteriota bacterium]
MTILHTFRGRLALILALLLIATLGVQYYANLVTQNDNIMLREAEERSIVAAIRLAFRSIPSESRMQDFLDEPGQTFFDDEARRRIKDIIVIDNNWEITDSLSTEYQPTTDDDDHLITKKLSELTDLPPLSDANRLGSDLAHFPNKPVSDISANEGDEAHAIPIETSQGRWYVMVLLRNDQTLAKWRAARPLIYTMGIFLVSSLITLLLVYRFGRPISNLADAARQVAAGKLDVRVPDANRNDEVGRLAQRFNEMTAELEKNRELEAQLQQAEKSAVVGRLGSAIAHEIRNPLNYINLTLDHLRLKYAPEDAEKREKFEQLTVQLKNEVARINQQISDFLNYSRPAKADLQSISARGVIEESLRIIEPEAKEKNVTVSVIEHENVPSISGDAEFLRSVFNNLFINALQAMESGGGKLSIKISPDEDGKRV